MRTRSGFVSNSSSSSFVCIYRKVDADSLETASFDDFECLMARGRYLGEGVDVIELDKALFGLLRKFPGLRGKLEFFDTVYSADEGEKELDIDRIVEVVAGYRKGKKCDGKLHINTFNRDQHSSTDVASFVDNYEGAEEFGDEAFEEYVVMMRNMKEL